ncbi:ABC transporter permease [Thiomonas sp. FB-Cd]|uniref:ABC transporter permease n=1 Tax=Thiomonas sp. FB-Cd TaxID=1158292 RepID=UPI0004DF3AE6|nr:ABC transporter permease [Thiomonas sp. FB-Cd]
MAVLDCAINDLFESLRAWRLWSLLGWLEIRQRYSRSKLGPLWLTISMGVMIGTLGVVYGTLFGQKLGDYLPMVAVGLVVWTLFSTIVNEGSMAYISSANYIRQVRTPRLLYVLQAGWRNCVIFAHNFAIVLLVLAILGVKSWAVLPLFVPGIALLVLNALWMAAFAGLLSARFRDLPQIVAALLQVAFYVTPILFSGTMLAGKHHWIVAFNPLSYLIDAVREPLLGQAPSATTWVVTGGMAALGWVLALALTGRFHKRIPYWV